MSETLYVFIKRDLFECPEHQGYTGIKERAGSWPLSLVKSDLVPVKDKYDPKYQDSYALPVDLAPDFTKSCFHDLAIEHLKKKVSDALALLYHADSYVIDGITEAKSQVEMNEPYPTRLPRYLDQLSEARQLHADITEALKGAKA